MKAVRWEDTKRQVRELNPAWHGVATVDLSTCLSFQAVLQLIIFDDKLYRIHHK